MSSWLTSSRHRPPRLFFQQRVIRFHLDQHVPNAVARALLARDIDVTTTASAGLQDATDAQHVLYALQERRVIFTQDQDFLRLHAASRKHAGIVYAKQSTKSIGEIVRALCAIHDASTQEDMFGRLKFF